MESQSSSHLSESRLALILFMLCLGFHFWGVSVGWQNKNLPGVEFRQAQTALSIYWIDAENDFSLAYPTPVLGKPWSIPMEFPLYQWTSVVVSKITNWSITKASRAVSIACFYLCLPAVFLLLKRWKVPLSHRWWVLSIVVTCPLYIFYTRGIFIETMALMFALWFWVAFERAVEEKSKGWLCVAMVTGVGSGLVKVTTYILYLLPPGIWALRRLWKARGDERWTDFKWMAGAVALPFVFTIWWVHKADAIKALNPLASFLNSANLREFNFGTLAMRLSGDVWSKQWAIITHELTWLPAAGIAAIAALFAGRERRWATLGCVAAFVSVLVIFPLLYALHDYYFMANTMLLLIGMGLALTGWIKKANGKGWAIIFAIVVPLGQAWEYRQHYYPVQSEVRADGNDLTAALREITRPDEVIVVLGQDWSSIIPYYARRKALMLRDDVGRDAATVESALQRLEGESLGALVIAGEPDGEQWLIDRCQVRGLSREPVLAWGTVKIHLPEMGLNETIQRFLDHPNQGLELAPGRTVPREHLAGKWIIPGTLRLWERRLFHAMSPQPVRYFSTFGPALDESGGQTRFGAHPVTRLVFELPAGTHVLRTTVQLPEAAYDEKLEPGAKTDGVEIVLYALGPNGEQVLLGKRHFDPVRNAADRGNQRPLEFEFTLLHPGEIELAFGPGPEGKDTRDWIEMGLLTIE